MEQGRTGRGGEQAATGNAGTASGLLGATSLPCWQSVGQACVEVDSCCAFALALDATVPFAINAVTGTITVNGPLDREQLSNEEILLEVIVSRKQQGEPHLLLLPGLLQPGLSSCPGT